MRKYLKQIVLAGFLIACFIAGPNIRAAIQIKTNEKMLVAPEGASYQWYFNGELLSDATGKTIPVKSSGSYTVSVQDHNGHVKTQQIQVVVEDNKVYRVFVIGGT